MNIGVAGHYGPGNVGDEAMLEGLAGWLIGKRHRPHVFVYEPRGSVLERYRYFDYAILDWRDRGSVRKLDALLIGGGALGPGFAWHLAAEALDRQIPVMSVGQTFGANWTRDAIAPLTKAFLRANALVLARDDWSVVELSKLGVSSCRSEDLATLLPRHDLPQRAAHALLFVRHDEPDMPAESQIAAARSAFAALRRHGPVMVGFCCPADRAFWRLYLEDLAVEQQWLFEDPRDCLRRCAQARVVVSLRRLHPAIFAGMAGTPCLAVPRSVNDVEDRLTRMASEYRVTLSNDDAIEVAVDTLLATSPHAQLPEPVALQRILDKALSGLPQRSAVSAPIDLPDLKLSVVPSVVGELATPTPKITAAHVREVVDGDCYRLRRLAATWQPATMHDVGVSAGEAARLALTLWPTLRVVGFDENEECVAAAQHNLPTARIVRARVGYELTGPELLRLYGEPDLLKIDCEGGEVPFFYDLARGDRLRNLRVVVGEWHFWPGRRLLESAFSGLFDCFFVDPRPSAGAWQIFFAVRRLPELDEVRNVLLTP